MTTEKMAWLTSRLKEFFIVNNCPTSFPRAAWECSQGALRRESCPTFCVYGTQRVRHGIPTQRVGTRKRFFSFLNFALSASDRLIFEDVSS